MYIQLKQSAKFKWSKGIIQRLYMSSVTLIIVTLEADLYQVSLFMPLVIFFPYKKRSHKWGHCRDCDWSTKSTRQSACLTVSLSESNLWRPSAAGQIRARPGGQSEKHHCHCNHSHSVNLASSATAWPRGHLTESRPGGLRG